MNDNCERLRELQFRAEEYDKVRKQSDGSANHVNTYENIAHYVDWFLESKEIFSNYFSLDYEIFKQFSNYSTAGNGFVLARIFNNTYSLFKILSKKILEGKVQPLEHDFTVNDTINKDASENITFSKRAFVVHGHNTELKLEVARFLEKEFGINAIILHEQPNRSRSIMEKFEQESKVDFAVALWTQDDQGRSNTDTELKPRARQNVIFETGYFIGKLGKEKVIVILETGLEAPSDYSGILYINANNWQFDLSREIKDIYST